MKRVRVKICGITRPEDAVSAAEAGADAIGLVFYQDSPRNVNVEMAHSIIAALPPFITKVGLFVDAGPAVVDSILEQLHLDLLQFHGEEPPEVCRAFKKPYIKSFRMRDNIDLTALATRYSDAAGLLLDSYVKGVAGGTGEAFDWDRIPAGLPVPVILAGGLTPENVASAIRKVRPYAVDVSGGVEAAKGVKDRDKIAAFIDEVGRAGP